MHRRRCLYLPGPSFYDKFVREYAGWWKILEYQKEAIESLGYEVYTPDVKVEGRESLSRIMEYSIIANDLTTTYDIIVGAPSYAHHAILTRGKYIPTFTYVWNNADFHRERMLKPEYQALNLPFPTSEANTILNKMSLEASTAVIACSEFVKSTHEEVVPGQKIRIAHWGVDCEAFYPADDRDNSTTMILFVGSDPVRKGLKYLLEGILPPDRRVQYILVGNNFSSWIPQDRTDIVNLGTIPHSEMARIMRQCHILVCPTLEDGIACVVQEAMASGVVPITTQECAEVFKDCGVTIPYRDSNSIRTWLNFFINTLDGRSDLRRRGKIGRVEAESQTWGKFKKEFAEILESEIKDFDVSRRV